MSNTLPVPRISDFESTEYGPLEVQLESLIEYRAVCKASNIVQERTPLMDCMVVSARRHFNRVSPDLDKYVDVFASGCSGFHVQMLLCINKFVDIINNGTTKEKFEAYDKALSNLTKQFRCMIQAVAAWDKYINTQSEEGNNEAIKEG